MTYNPGQFLNVVPFVTVPPQALILAGPADGDEAQVAKQTWPWLNVIGLEPNPDLRRWQVENNWPGLLLMSALSDRKGTDTLYFHHDPKTNGRASRLKQDFGAGGIEVPTTTLDDLARDYLNRREKELMIWLDIEGHELQALRGGRRLFEFGRVRYVNVEALDRLWITNGKIDRFLTGYGFKCVHEWNVQEGLVRDKFYRRD